MLERLHSDKPKVEHKSALMVNQLTHSHLIHNCSIELPGVPAMNLSPAWDKLEAFKYFGSGFADGQCGVTIRQVRAHNNGLVKCFLGTTDGDEAIGQMPLTVAREYKPRELFV